jgi:DNA-binding beta-propeller fold protein YncE
MRVMTMSRAASLRVRKLCALAVAAAIAPVTVLTGLTPAVAAVQNFSAVQRYIFVPSRNTQAIAVVERDSDRVVGTIDAGLVPAQIFISEAVGKLVAVAAGDRKMSVVDLKNGDRRSVEFDFVPQRLLGSADGNLVGAADLSTGKIAFVELVRVHEVSRVTGLPPIRDLLLGADGAFLYVAADNLRGVGVIDIARGKLIAEIPTFATAPGDVSGLTRSPSGRLGYAKERDGRSVSLLDLSNFRPLTQLEVGRAASKAYPTGFGGYLVVPDSVEKSVTVVATASMTIAAMLKGSAGMTTVYSGWFDTLALVPSVTDRKLLIYDLDQLAGAGEIALAGVPGAGAVTPEGTKLYLTVEGTKQVAVVDLQTKRLMKAISIDFEPLAAIMARSFDICHN